MYRIVRLDLLLKYTALTTVVISIAVYAIVQTAWFPTFSLFRVITISSIVSTIIIMVLLSPYFSRKIWATVGLLNKSLYPDLNGTWQGQVTLESGSSLAVRAVIRQSLITTQIDMHGETLKSTTLETTPTIEKGQKKLYYVYRCIPKTPGWPSYLGSTVLDIRRVETDGKVSVELTGCYYTDRKTIGRIALHQTGVDTNSDVSFY